MANSVTLFLWSDHDPIYAVARSALPKDNCVNLREFCKNITVNRSGRFPSVHVSHVTWAQAGISRVVNRVFDVRQSLLSNLVVGWDGLSPNWFYAGVDEGLRELRPIYPWARAGVSRSYLPLPTQWYIIRQAGLSVFTPNYVYGVGESLPDTDSLRDPVEASVLPPFRDVGRELPPSVGKRSNRFFVERPRGTRVACWRIGGGIVVGSERFRNKNTQELLSAATREISRLLMCELCETVFFIEDTDITFYGCSPMLETLSGDGPARKRLLDWLESAEPTSSQNTPNILTGTRDE